MGFRKTTAADDLEIVRLVHETTMTQLEIAKRFNVTNIVVQRALREHGQPVNPNRRRPYNVNVRAFDDLSQEGAAYWLGFLFADGGINRSNVNIALAMKDFDQVVRFLDFIQCEKQPIEVMRNSGDGKMHPVAYVSPRIHLCGTAEMMAAIEMIFREAAGTNLVRIQFSKTGKLAKLQYKGVHRCAKIVEFLYRDATIWMPRKRERIDAWPKPQRAQMERYCPTCGHTI